MFRDKYTIEQPKLVGFDDLFQSGSPPRIVVDARPHPDWSGRNPEELEAVLYRMIEDRKSDLYRFLYGQRQNYALGIVSSQYTNLSVPGMQTKHSITGGNESIHITLYPDAPKAGTKPNSLTLDVNPALVLKLDAPFVFWPMPGSQTLENPPDDWVRNDTKSVNCFDPAFAPLNNAGDPPVSAPAAASDPLHPKTYISSGLNHRWDGSDDRNPSIQNGLVESMWLGNKSGGTVIAPYKVTGKCYWEVHVKRLPTQMPSSDFSEKTKAENPKGEYLTSPISDFQDFQGTRKLWPVELNTFLNPMIGIAPGLFMNRPLGEGSFTHYILGLDPDLRQPRSIYAVPTSTMRGTPSGKRFRAGYYAVRNTGVDPITLSNGQVVEAGQEGYLADLNPVTEAYPGQTWSGSYVPTLNAYTGDRDDIFRVALLLAGNSTMSQYGPSQGEGVDPPSDEFTSVWISTYPNVRWVRVGRVGGPLYSGASIFNSGPLDVIANSLIVRYEHGLVDDEFEEDIYGDFVSTRPDSSDTFVYLPWEATVGKHTPVLKGRMDFIGLTRDPARKPFEEPPYDVTVTTTGPVDREGGAYSNGTGIDTGVDLGELQVDDVIMIACDATTQKVWFGKNGDWIVAPGGIRGDDTDKEPEPENGKGYITYLDKPEDANVDYYPAMSYRLGPTQLEMHLGPTCQYQPPSGFKVIADLKTTLEVDLGDTPE